MPVHKFIAATAADAIAQIRAALGPDAVVLNVRRPPVEGLARLWQKPSIEVLAHVPDSVPPAIQPDVLAELREELREIRHQVEGRPAAPADHRVAFAARSGRGEAEGQGACAADESAWIPRTLHEDVVAARLSGWSRNPDQAEPGEAQNLSGWRVGAVLEHSGLLPLHVASVVEELRVQHGDVPPNSLAEEFELARKVLLERWKPAAPGNSAHPDLHVFIGPAGTGKTTCLCKWLAQTVLVEGRPAAVWRLDGHVANTAESLSVFCEILGVPMERFQPARPAFDDGVLFIDLPGVNPADPAGLAALSRQLSQLPCPQVHLVLNGAYETPLLLAQVRAFASLPITDLIVTHLDEASRWGKLWNFVLGTNYPLRFLSAGQNIPGEFTAATPARILGRQFARK